MSTSLKTCFKCNNTLPMTEFYKHSAMKDECLNKCKECTKKDTGANRVKNIRYYREYDEDITMWRQHNRQAAE